MILAAAVRCLHHDHSDELSGLERSAEIGWAAWWQELKTDATSCLLEHGGHVTAKIAQIRDVQLLQMVVEIMLVEHSADHLVGEKHVTLVRGESHRHCDDLHHH